LEDVDLISNQIYLERYLFEVAVFGHKVELTLPRLSSIILKKQGNIDSIKKRHYCPEN
jgi:hypothetical protein